MPPKPHSSSSTVVNRNAEAQQQSRTKTPSSAKQAPTPTPKSAPAAGPVATGPVSTKIGEDKTPKLESKYNTPSTSTTKTTNHHRRQAKHPFLSSCGYLYVVRNRYCGSKLNLLNFSRKTLKNFRTFLSIF